MTKKIAALILTCALLLVGVAVAGDKNKAMSVDEKVAKLQAELQLDSNQTAQVKSAYEDFNQKYTALKAQNLSQDAMKAEKTKLKEDLNARLKTVLTTEQWAKYEQMSARKSAEHASKKQ